MEWIFVFVVSGQRSLVPLISKQRYRRTNNYSNWIAAVETVVEEVRTKQRKRKDHWIIEKSSRVTSMISTQLIDGGQWLVVMEILSRSIEDKKDEGNWKPPSRLREKEVEGEEREEDQGFFHYISLKIRDWCEWTSISSSFERKRWWQPSTFRREAAIQYPLRVLHRRFYSPSNWLGLTTSKVEKREKWSLSLSL